MRVQSAGDRHLTETARGRDATPIASLIDRLVAWASYRQDVHAVGLVGSHARGTARPDSDIDVLLLVDEPRRYLRDRRWARRFGAVASTESEDWQAVQPLRVFYADGPEVEFGFARPFWAAVDPVDAGTRQVVRDGLRVLWDPQGLLGALQAQVATGR